MTILAVTAVLTGGIATGQSSGAPLTKPEYFAKSVQLGSTVDLAISARYYKLALQRYPPKKCAGVAERMNAEFASTLAEAKLVIPPPEIAGLHSDLIATADQVVRGIGQIAKRARAGKIACGESFRERPRAEAADKMYRLFSRSRFDEILKQLADLGYIPSGE